MPKPYHTDNPLRSLTRLAIGAVLLSKDELQRQLRQWEEKTDNQIASQRTVLSPGSLPTPVQQVPAQVSSAEVRPPSAPPSPVDVDTPADIARYVLIGVLFDAQSRLSSAVGRLTQIDPALSKLVSPVLHTLNTMPALAPVRQQFEACMTRGATEVEHWIALGKAEERYSRLLAHTAMQSGVESSIHQVVTNPEVLDLIQEQGTDLAHEVIEEVRERAVSTDTFLERLVRVILRRPPREELPEPPETVRIHAISLHSSES